MIPSSSGSTNFEIPDRITTPVPHVRTRAILPKEARRVISYHYEIQTYILVSCTYLCRTLGQR